MTQEDFDLKMSAITNEQLIFHVENEISKLAKSGGLSHRMCVPPEPTDTDMILSEMLKRFKSFQLTNSEVEVLIKAIVKKNESNPNAFFESGVRQGINSIINPLFIISPGNTIR